MWTVKLSSEVEKTPHAGTRLLGRLWVDCLESKPPKSGRARELPPPPLDQNVGGGGGKLGTGQCPCFCALAVDPRLVLNTKSSLSRWMDTC